MTRNTVAFFLNPVEARHHRLQPPFEDQPRSRQRRPAVVGQGATHRGAVTVYRLGLRVVTALDLALDRPHPADALLQFLLGVAVGLEDRLGCLAEVVEVAELVRDTVERLFDRLADRVLAVGDHADDRDRQRLLDLGDQSGQVVLGRGQEASGQQDLAREAVAEHPEDLMADIGLQAVDGQDHAAFALGHPPEAVGVGQRQGEQFIVPVEQVGHAALTDGHATADHLGVDLGDAAVLGVAQGADQRDEVQAELVLGQDETPFGLRSQGPPVPRAVGLPAAADLDDKSDGPVESDHRAAIGVGGPKRRATLRAARGQTGQIELAVGYGSGGPSSHRCTPGASSRSGRNR